MPYLQVSGERKIYYAEEGSGQPVIFIHGWKASSNVYEIPSHILAQKGNYRCIRYDQCGHMRSDVPANDPTLSTLAEDLHELIIQLNLENPILVGWSMGGLAVLEYLRKYGCDDLDRVVIVDIAPKNMNTDGWTFGKPGGAKGLAAAKQEALLLKENPKEFLRIYYGRSIPGFPQKTPDEQNEIIRQRLEGHHPKVLASLWLEIRKSDYLTLLPHINCPVAVFHAGILPSCSAGAAQYYKEHIPGPVRTVLFENNSHGLISENAPRFVAELLSFFTWDEK